MKGNFKSMKGFVLGFSCCALLTSGIAYAADAVKLDAFFGVKLMQNGIDKTPQEDDLKPFIANGRTYVPLKAVGDLLGVDVNWDGANTAVIIGGKIEGTPLSVPNSVKNGNEGYAVYAVSQNQPMTINGKSYGSKGFKFYTEHNDFHDTKDLNLKFTYNLNAQYSKLTFSIGMDDVKAESDESRTVAFTNQDGKVINSFLLSKGSIQEAITINVKGVTELNIEVSSGGTNSFEYPTVDLINPVLN
ncbi:hypothetical protein QFZ81_003869 [Paenibacillus sp. V4I9]|uniref:stalk domain-containing protein n=1 Tax=Paenibacillus sp. V4I9 TaxID=3042308 RepID=UPI002789F285|nr:NPCBM/NEW2 domain-containing protein [Paenibacillus sp. V4I9]MDQ0888781.1 hypothetical protein [Paenibacillus sp. V4I9]